MAVFSLQDWDDVGEIVEAALARPHRERRAFLQEQCGADGERFDRAIRTLGAAERAEHFLDRPAAALVPSLVQDLLASDENCNRDAAPIGTVGAYRVLREIGRGGMADVYLAERADDEYRKHVALKIVRFDPGGDLSVRFRYERQVLATLDHPHIARLYDGGMTADGRPYLVMEYVAGQPIDRYVKERGLSLRERLALFDQVCEALAHAHRRLVVHRDLKPGNILVSAEGEVKLLDFGVAKLLDPEETAGAIPITRVGMRIMTPEYASPEQFRGDAVTTATDVYALGALLFELLTGERPYAHARRPAEIERAALHEDPDRPSDVVARHAAPNQPTLLLRRELQGDLDNIVGKALQREPESRYPSVEALRADIGRYLAGLPVAARPATFAYRTAKFVRRHRAMIAAAAVVAIAALTAAGVSMAQTQAALREGERAARIRDFLFSVFENADPDRSQGAAITARDLLDRGAQRVDHELANQPELRADMLGVLGTINRRLGLYDQAANQLTRALELRRATAPRSRALAASLTDLAAVLVDAARYEDAEALLDEGLALREALDGPESAAAASVVADLAALQRLRGRHDDAEPLYRKALAIHRTENDEAGIAAALNGLALNLSAAGRPTEAVPLLQDAIVRRRALHGDRHSQVAESVCNLAYVLGEAGDLSAAVGAHDECVSVKRALLGSDHPSLGRSLNNLAMVHATRGALDEAERLHREALAIRRQAFGAHHPEVAGSLTNLAVVAYQRGNHDAAATRFREVVDVWTALVGPDHPNTLTTANNLGMALKESGRLDEAERVLTGILERRRRVQGDTHPQVAESLTNLAGLFEGREQYARAIPLVTQAIEILDHRFPDGHLLTASAEAVLGRVTFHQARLAEALPHLERALALRARFFGDDDGRTADARLWVGRCLAGLGRRDEAVAALAAAHTALVAARGAESASARQAADALAAARR